jgi:uncharacterized protein (TIGR02246 family)
MNTDEQAIRDTQAAWLQASAEGDLARLLTLMADDIVFLAPGRPPFGRDVFAAQFTAGREQVRLSCSGVMEEVVVVQDMAYTRTRLHITATPLANGKPQQLAGYALSVFRRQPDGKWVLARDASLLAPA